MVTFGFKKGPTDFAGKRITRRNFQSPFWAIGDIDFFSFSAPLKLVNAVSLFVALLNIAFCSVSSVKPIFPGQWQ